MSKAKEGFEDVQPATFVDNESGGYTYRYEYDEIHLEDIPDDVEPQALRAEFWWDGDVLYYQYKDLPKVRISDDGVEAEVYQGFQQARRQAYFALSQLDAMGYISTWRKK